MSAERVLITGASSGIGLALAKLFAADGSELILVARREDRLQELAQRLKQQHGTQSTVIARDMAVEGSAEQLMTQLERDGIAVDVLVNNAGFGQLGRFQEIPRKRQTNMIDLNIRTLMELTHLCLPAMLERRSGAILNLGSTAAFQPGPNCAVYYATKAFVLSFSEALWQELQGTGVTVTCLCPGPTRTEFGEESRMHDTPVFQHNAMDVDDVAQAGYHGLRRGKRLVMPGVVNKLLATSVRLTPRSVILKVMSGLQPLQD